MYLSPEMILETGYSFPADLWQLGVVLYELLMGKNPFNHVDEALIYAKILREPVLISYNVDFQFRTMI